MSEGIRVSRPKHSVTDAKNIAFTTESDYLKLDVRHTPKMFDYQTYQFLTPPPTPILGATVYTDMLIIPHNLGYIPTTIVYIYAYQFVSAHIPANSYQLAPMGLTDSGFIQQTINYYVDDQQFRVYYTDNNGASDIHAVNPVDLTNMKFGIKYYIFNNEMTKSTQ
jgi:hypothetical protein